MPAYTNIASNRNFEGSIRHTSTVPTLPGEFEHYDYDYYHRDNTPNRKTDPNQENLFITQTDDLARKGMEQESFYDTMHSANNTYRGVNARDAIEFRDYSENPYVHDGSRVWQREISEARDRTNQGHGYFGGLGQEVANNRMGLQDKHVRHRQARHQDHNAEFHEAAPTAGPTRHRMAAATHNLMPWADRQGYADLDGNFAHDDNMFAGWVEF